MNQRCDKTMDEYLFESFAEDAETQAVSEVFSTKSMREEPQPDGSPSGSPLVKAESSARPPLSIQHWRQRSKHL